MGFRLAATLGSVTLNCKWSVRRTGLREDAYPVQGNAHLLRIAVARSRERFGKAERQNGFRTRQFEVDKIRPNFLIASKRDIFLLIAEYQGHLL